MSTAQAVAGAMFVASLAACAREPAAAMRAATPRPPVSTAHDFDFERGTWHTHLRRLVHPLAGSTKWVEYDGTSVVRPVWDGRANLVELDVIGPEGHIVGLSVRLFDPQARTWSLNFASAAGGGMAVPAMGGGQERARGVLRTRGRRGSRTGSPSTRALRLRSLPTTFARCWRLPTAPMPIGSRCKAPSRRTARVLRCPSGHARG
jgi:hypothetical protein